MTKYSLKNKIWSVGCRGGWQWAEESRGVGVVNTLISRAWSNSMPQGSALKSRPGHSVKVRSTLFAWQYKTSDWFCVTQALTDGLVRHTLEYRNTIYQIIFLIEYPPGWLRGETPAATKSQVELPKRKVGNLNLVWEVNFLVCQENVNKNKI